MLFLLVLPIPSTVFFLFFFPIYSLSSVSPLLILELPPTSSFISSFHFSFLFPHSHLSHSFTPIFLLFFVFPIRFDDRRTRAPHPVDFTLRIKENGDCWFQRARNMAHLHSVARGRWGEFSAARRRFPSLAPEFFECLINPKSDRRREWSSFTREDLLDFYMKL